MQNQNYGVQNLNYGVQNQNYGVQYQAYQTYQYTPQQQVYYHPNGQVVYCQQNLQQIPQQVVYYESNSKPQINQLQTNNTNLQYANQDRHVQQSKCTDESIDEGVSEKLQSTQDSEIKSQKYDSEIEYSEEYKVEWYVRIFYLIRFLATLFFITILVYQVVTKITYKFRVYYSVDSLDDSKTYLAKDQSDVSGCTPLADKFYGELVTSDYFYLIVPLICVLLQKLYILSFQFQEVYKGTFVGLISNDLRNGIRLRDTQNFIIDFTFAIALSPYTAFMFQLKTCGNWSFGLSLWVINPPVVFIFSLIWAAFAFSALFVFTSCKQKLGNNLRPLGLVLLLPMLTFRAFSCFTNYYVPPTVYKVTTYTNDFWGVEKDVSYVTDYHCCRTILMKLIGLLGQFILPFYEILFIIIQFPYMYAYTIIPLNVYYGLTTILFLITTKIHKRRGYD